MKEVLVASCGIAAAALGAIALSAEPLKMSRTVTDVFRVDAGEGAGDRKPSEAAGIRIAQAAPPAGQPVPPAVEPGKPSADDRNAQPPEAAKPGMAAPADDPNGQAAPADQKAGAADDPNGQAAPTDQKAQAAGGQDDDDDEAGADDDRDGVDD
jgi:hypothetical protein